MSQLVEVRRSVHAVARNGRLLRAQSAYALFAVNEQALWVAVLLWAYDSGGTALAGLVAVLQLVPAAALAPLGGVVGDRMPRDHALRLVYGLQAVTMAATAGLIAAGGPRGPVVLAAVAATIVIGWTRPPHYAATTELSSSPGEAAAANSLSGTLESLGCFVGPALAGLGALVGGIAVVVAGCAVLAAAAALLVSGLGLARPGPRVPLAQAQAGPRVRSDSLVGALWHRPAAAVVLLLVGAQFVAVGTMEILGVAYAVQRLGAGPAAAGLLIGSLGVGGTLGAAGAVVLCGWQRLAGAVAASLLAGALPLLLMPHLGALLPALLVGVAAGAGLAFFAVAGITLLQRTVADSLLARVLALRESALLTGLAVGAAAAPLLVRAVGAGPAYAVLGGTLSVVAVLAVPVLVRLDRQAVYRPDVVRLLRGVEFLAVLDVRALERLAQQARCKDIAAGTLVLRQGERGDGYYLVEHGRLDVSVAGRAERVALGPGDGFGEIALLHDVPRTASVRATEACRLWYVGRADFLATVAGSAGAELAHRHVADRLERLA